MELDVGRSRAPVRVPKSAGLEQASRSRAGLEQRDIGAPPRAVRCGCAHAIIGVLSGAFGDRVEIQVILHVRADAGQVVHDGHAGRLQRVRGPDAGELQQAWRADRAAADDDLPVGAQVSVPPDAPTVTPTARPFWTSIFSVVRVQAHRQVLRDLRSASDSALDADERSALRVVSW